MAKTILGFDQHAPFPLLWGRNDCCLCNENDQVKLLQARVLFLENEIKRMTKRIDHHPIDNPKPRRLEDICRLAVLQDSHCILQAGHLGNHRDSTGFETCRECRAEVAMWGHRDNCPRNTANGEK